MAKNQRQRRPLQDDTRQNKQTVRERAQVSKRQRDRIEENRDRRERRRERERSRRQQVDSVRSPKEDVRIDRFDSRLNPVEDTFLGRPVGAPTDLPVLIGERWALSGNVTFGNDTEGIIDWDISQYTTERNGYPSLYQGSGIFRIPAGLAGIWEVAGTFQWTLADADGFRLHKVEYTDNTLIAYQAALGTASTYNMFSTKQFQEGDEFRVTALQDSGSSIDMVGDSGGTFTYFSLAFRGK